MQRGVIFQKVMDLNVRVHAHVNKDMLVSTDTGKCRSRYEKLVCYNQRSIVCQCHVHNRRARAPTRLPLKNLGGVSMTPGRLSPRSKSLRFPLVALYLFTCYHDHKMSCRREAPRFLYRGENFTSVRNLAAVSCKHETTNRFGVKSDCRQTGTGGACVSSIEKLSFKITHSFDHLIESNLLTNMLINSNNSSMRFECKRISLTMLFGF